MENQNVGTFSIQGLWNDLITEDRPMAPRDYIRGSDIGKPYLDRYLAMKGVPYSNPFQSRIKRIFDCGLIFEEAIERIFRILGLLIDSQAEVAVEMPGMLKVVGHYDQRVGGKIDVDKSRKALEDENVPEWLKNRASKLLEKLSQENPDGFQTLITEIKTVNSMAFWAHKNVNPETGMFKGYDHHKLQLLTYLLATGEEQGRIFYISKDDLTLMELGVMKDSPDLIEKWEEDVATMTKYYRENIEPPKEDDIIWDEHKKVFVTNWMIERSNYFTHITGFDSVEKWQDSLKAELKAKNTTQCKACKKDFTLQTLNKNKGYCLKCFKLKGGEDNE